MTSKPRRLRRLLPLLAALTTLAVAFVPSPRGGSGGDRVLTT
ncbi:MAG TPA: hypothetical protein VHM65_00550 [Candidatus Lustribacter sp.]|nr:hypothetical protein [Candidatus Lustribacter sp.]